LRGNAIAKQPTRVKDVQGSTNVMLKKRRALAKNTAKTLEKFERPLAALRIQMNDDRVVEDSDELHGDDDWYLRNRWSCWENWRWSTNS